MLPSQVDNLSHCVVEAPLQSDVPALTQEPAQFITTMQIDGEFTCLVVQQKCAAEANTEVSSLERLTLRLASLTLIK